MFPVNKSIFTHVYYVNEVTINDHLPADKDNISPDFNIHGGLINISDVDFKTNAVCSANTSLQIEYIIDINLTSQIMFDVCQKKFNIE